MDYNRLAVSESEFHKPTHIRETGFYLRGFKPGLGFKLTVLVTGIALASLLIATFLLFNFQRQQIIQNADSNTSALSNTIKANLRHAMISVDRNMINEILQAVVAEETVKTVRILDVQGIVSASSSGSEVGLRYKKSQSACQVCHASQTPTTDRTVIYSTSAGRQILLNVNLLKNDAECRVCHAASGPVLGVLMIETPLDAVQEQLNAGYLRTGFLALGTFAVLVGVLVLVLRKYVIEPVEELEKGVEEITVGNLEGQIQVANRDELGRLAESLNLMRKQLRVSRAEMQERNQELSVLNEVALTVSQSLDLQEVLNRALETVTEKLGMQAGFINLRDKSTGQVTLRTYRGVPEMLIRAIEQRSSRDPDWDVGIEVIRTGKTSFLENMASDSRFEGLWDHQDERSCMMIPLKSKGKVVGTLTLVSYAGRQMHDRTVVVVEAIANEIGIAIDNAQLMAESHLNEHEAITLSQVGMQVSASLALRDVLNAVAEAARKLLEADIGLVALIDEERQELVIKAVAGIRAEGLVGIRSELAGETRDSGWLSGKPVIGAIDEPHPFITFDKDSFKAEKIESFLVVPLERGGHILGLVQVMTRQRRIFLPRDAQLLMRLAHLVVVSIENAQLYRQLRYLAVFEERDRIAGEMHDHLSQTLGYMNIKTSLIGDMLQDGQVAQAREGLKELKDAAKIAYTDVREAIFNLRSSVSPGAGLLGSLQNYLAEYRTYYGLDTYLDIEDEDLADISPEVAAQLFRIIQEALVNVRKHANANKVHITCRPSDDQVCLTIEDNGRGFTPDQVNGSDRQHFGLQIMRERAESAGGSLKVDSRPGRGTRVIVSVPVLAQLGEGI